MRFGADVDPALASGRRTALGCSGFGWLPALAASTAAARHRARAAPPRSVTGRCCPCTGTTPARRDASAARAAHGAGASRKPGCSAPPAAWSCVAGSARGRSRSSCRGRSAELRRAATSPPSRSWRRWYETRFCGSSTSCVSSRTARSLSTSASRKRQRSGWATSFTNPGGSPTARPAGIVACTIGAYPAIEDQIKLD